MALTLHSETMNGEFLADPGKAPQDWEEELLHCGVAVPFQHRSAWLRSGTEQTWAIRARGSDGRVTGGLVASVAPTRVLPGHRVIRVERFGAAGTEDGRRCALTSLVQSVRRDRRVLSVVVEVFARGPDVRASAGQVLEGLGFVRAAVPRHYVNTIVVDLDRNEEEIFASFRPTARQNIRVIAKHPVVVRPVEHTAYADRLNALLAESMSRTAGHRVLADWHRILQVSRQHPELSRVAGMFRTDRDSPDDLLAFAWGRMHGDHVEYSLAASTRQTELRLPQAYAPVWDLMRWARNNGARWWDFGGITAGTNGSGDALGGISDFKRRFSKDVVTVGEEWHLEPHPSRARVAHWLRRAANGLKLS